MEARRARFGLAKIWPASHKPLFSRENLNKGTMITKGKKEQGVLKWKEMNRWIEIGVGREENTTIGESHIVRETVSRFLRLYCASLLGEINAKF